VLQVSTSGLDVLTFKVILADSTNGERDSVHSADHYLWSVAVLSDRFDEERSVNMVRSVHQNGHVHDIESLTG
jgi:hypothetical protein